MIEILTSPWTALFTLMVVFGYVFKPTAEPAKPRADLEETINYATLLKELSDKTGTDVVGVRQVGYSQAEIKFVYFGKRVVVACEINPGVILWKRVDMIPMALAIVDEAAGMQP